MHVCFYKIDADIYFHTFTFYHQYHVWAMMLLLKILDIHDGRKGSKFCTAPSFALNHREGL